MSFSPDLFKPGSPTRVMAVINVSGESFYGGSVASDEGRLTEAVRRAEQEGAAMIDIGAMSTAPYKEARIPEEEERRRMAWGVQVARSVTGLPISADTQRLSVAEAALDAGADVINDVSGLLANPGIGELCSERGAGLVLMASEFGPVPENGPPGQVVGTLLREAVDRAVGMGVPRENLLVDPGVGFFRNRSITWHEWDLGLLRDPGAWRQAGLGCLVGASRKSLFGPLLGRTDPGDRLAGSLGVAAWCAARGVEWLRVHDVAATRDVVRVLQLLSG